MELYQEYRNDAYHFGECIGESITLNFSMANCSNIIAIHKGANIAQMGLEDSASVQPQVFIDFP